MSHGHSHRRRAVSAGAIVATVLFSHLPSASAASSVSPKKWAAAFCDIVADFQEDLGTVSDEIKTTTSDALVGLASDPSGVFDVIEDVSGFLDDSADIATDGADRMRALPRPRVGGGAKIKRVLSSLFSGGLDDIADEFEGGATDLRSIADETDDPVVAATQFKTKSEELATTFGEAGTAISETFDALPDDSSIDPDGALDRALDRSRACTRLGI